MWWRPLQIELRPQFFSKLQYFPMQPLTLELPQSKLRLSWHLVGNSLYFDEEVMQRKRNFPRRRKSLFYCCLNWRSGPFYLRFLLNLPNVKVLTFIIIRADLFVNTFYFCVTLAKYKLCYFLITKAKRVRQAKSFSKGKSLKIIFYAMGHKRKGKSVRKNKSRTAGEEDEELVHAPHSFVIHRGAVGKYVQVSWDCHWFSFYIIFKILRAIIDIETNIFQELSRDFRQVMEPFTASKIKVRPKNVIKDFVHVASLLNVSHMCMFTKTAIGPYFKVARFPRGPTLTFRIQEYALARDVR